jgi:hypothetical protein
VQFRPYELTAKDRAFKRLLNPNVLCKFSLKDFYFIFIINIAIISSLLRVIASIHFSANIKPVKHIKIHETRNFIKIKIEDHKDK